MPLNAVVTGASRGIGRAIALRFASAGFDLAICGRDPDTLKAIEQELLGGHPNIKVHSLPTDLSKKEEVQRFAEMIKSNWKAPDVLVNNAGTYIPGMVHNEEDGLLEKLINTNLYSAYNLSRALIEPMKANGSGHIFNICSTASTHNYVNSGSYCISKAAQLSFSRALRLEMLHHNIRVTAVLPGAVLTDSWAGTTEPEERFMKPEDIAEAVLNAYELSDRTVLEEIVLRPQKGDL